MMNSGKEDDGVAFGRLVQNGLQIFCARSDGPDLGMGGPYRSDGGEDRRHRPCRSGSAEQHEI